MSETKGWDNSKDIIEAILQLSGEGVIGDEGSESYRLWANPTDAERSAIITSAVAMWGKRNLYWDGKLVHEGTEEEE